MTIWLDILFFLLWLQLSPWQGILIYAGTVVFGILTNFGIAAYYAGKYVERVERLTNEVRSYEGELEETTRRISKLERQFSAYTGIVNGADFGAKGG
jgi:hypothetical protein